MCAHRLREKYGDAVPANGPIPADLLGNMWAQDWDNIYPLVAPPNADPGYDLTELLKKRNTDWKQMVKYGENFFVSLGFAPLPQTFWERSLFLKPRDREVVCHASAWDVDAVDDLRLKMCIQITGEDFNTIHHELGHNFYQRAYNQRRRCSATAPTTASTKPSATPSRFPSRRIPGETRPARPGARHLQGYRPAAAPRAREDRVPALRAADRSVALEGLFRRDHAGPVQRRPGGSCA